jgi:glycosyltransferase involved in cell wall biosynthesis
MLASEARKHPALTVLETDLTLTGKLRADCLRVARAGRKLASAEIVHVQYNNQPTGSVWGAGWRQLLHLWIFAAAARAPLVATVHDIYRRLPPAATRRSVPAIRTSVDPQASTLQWLQRRTRCLFVCSDEERARLAHVDSAVRVIPMFVEPRAVKETPEQARAALGLSGKRVVTLLGFIHGRKGHRLLIEALSTLPDEVVAVFAGGAVQADSSVIPDLLAFAQARGVAERLRITGYLPEDDLELYLAATHLAVCPFRDVSASASLSTWISAGRPILASDLPLIAEYNTLAPGAIRTFQPYTADALADGVRAALYSDPGNGGGVARLRDRLLLPLIFDRFTDAYREITDSRPG